MFTLQSLTEKRTPTTKQELTVDASNIKKPRTSIFSLTEAVELKQALLQDWGDAYGVVCLSTGDEFHLNGAPDDVVISFPESRAGCYVTVEDFKSSLNEAEIISLTDGGLSEEDCNVLVIAKA